MTLEEPLLRILACPIDKQELLYFAADELLYNPRLRRVYRFSAGVPVLLASRAEPATEPQHASLLARAVSGEAITTGNFRSAGEAGRH